MRTCRRCTVAPLGRHVFPARLPGTSDGIAAAWDALGGIDVLVNNAGIGMRTVNPRFMTDPQPFWIVEPDRFRDLFATNVTGYFLLARVDS